MADIQIVLSGVDAASDVIHSVGDALSGLAGIATAGLTVAFEAAAAAAVTLTAGLGTMIAGSIDAENTTTALSFAWQKASDAAKNSTSETALSSDALATLRD